MIYQMTVCLCVQHCSELQYTVNESRPVV